MVERSNGAGTDIILVTGDFINGSVDMYCADMAPLARLHTPDGILAIPGNHEYFFNYADWMHPAVEVGISNAPEPPYSHFCSE